MCQEFGKGIAGPAFPFLKHLVFLTAWKLSSERCSPMWEHVESKYFLEFSDSSSGVRCVTSFVFYGISKSPRNAQIQEKKIRSYLLMGSKVTMLTNMLDRRYYCVNLWKIQSATTFNSTLSYIIIPNIKHFERSQKLL